ncbi:MAG: DUF4112 domain-containing protein [Candidatus Gottesmanbacteria bacterium]|nr:DUF4112 domain-containing protein [Candidatus Gottesmanbacteria bacterium]
MKSHIAFAQRLVTLMDTKFNVFGIRFGIDPILDILPGFGSMIGAGISCYLFWIAYQLKVPSRLYWRMGWHIVLDYLLGLLPFIGIVADLFYRSNTKNLTLLHPFIDPEILEGVVMDV